VASLALRNRLATSSAVAGFLLATHALWPDPQARAERQYLFVITLGYGHLLGAALFGRRRTASLVPRGTPRPLHGAFVAASVANLFALYAWLSNASLAIFLPLLAVSLWHIVENDLALGRASQEGLALGALPRSLGQQLTALGTTALLLAAGKFLLSHPPRGPRDLSFGDFFSAVTLYHLVQFLVLFADRARAQPRRSKRRRLWLRLAWVHGPPASVCVALLLPPGHRFAALRYAIFSPQIYLFWSVLHVAQTVAARGLERRPARAPAELRA